MLTGIPYGLASFANILSVCLSYAQKPGCKSNMDVKYFLKLTNGK